MSAEPRSRFRRLPERRSWRQLVEAFVCRSNVNTREPLAGENTSELNCGLHWLQACRCSRFCRKKKHHMRRDPATSSCQVKTAAARSRLWLQRLWCKESFRMACLWSATAPMLSLTLFEMRLQTKKRFSSLLFLFCRLWLKRTKRPRLSFWTRLKEGEEKKDDALVLNVCPLRNGGIDLWKKESGNCITLSQCRTEIIFPSWANASHAEQTLT